MRRISPLDLRRSLGSILDAASAGERFLIERGRRPLAMLVSVEDGDRLEASPEEQRTRRLAALDALADYADQMARRYSRPVDTPGAAELIREERSRDDGDGTPEYPDDVESGHD